MNNVTKIKLETGGKTKNEEVILTNNLLYIIHGDKDSEKAIKILTECGVKFKMIYVGREGNGKSMWRDIGTIRIPTLHSPKGTFIGIKEIEDFCKK